VFVPFWSDVLATRTSAIDSSSSSNSGGSSSTSSIDTNRIGTGMDMSSIGMGMDGTHASDRYRALYW
jgi:hypothetical protein